MDPDRESLAARGPGWEERRTHREERRNHWELRAGEWQGMALARHVFGERVEVRLEARHAPHPFRGMLTLRVPFRSLEEHRVRERVFLALVARDPVIRQVPFLYLFEPLPEPRARVRPEPKALSR
jgi:hypothetical protein